MLITVLTLAACNTETKIKNINSNASMQMKNEDGHTHDHSKMKMDSNHKNREKKVTTLEQNGTKNPTTTPIINAYLAIKNGLVATDKKVTAQAATKLLVAFKQFDMSKLSGDTHNTYMEIYENAKEQAEHILKSKIDHQREHFEILSTDIKDLIDLLGTEKTLYQDHCPMASDGNGADWISEVKDIKNPYFGSKMLKCGSVTKQIN
jgi:hypothetical protein